MKSPFYEQIPTRERDSRLLVFERREPTFPFAWHYHAEYELTHIVRSRGTRVVGDHMGPYGDGDLVLLGPNLPHTWESDGAGDKPMVAVGMQFQEEILGDSFLEQPELRRVRQLLHELAPRGVFWARVRPTLQRRLRAMPRRQGLPRILELLALLDALAQEPRELLCSPDYSPHIFSPDRQRLERVTDFLHANFREPLTLAQVAELAAMSPSHFSRFFKRATQMTFVAYVNHLRIGWVCRHLLESDSSIAAAAYAVGYNNLANFNRRFRAIKGMSPTAYLRRFKA